MQRDYKLLEQNKRSIVDINCSIYWYIYELMYICLGFQSRFVGSHYLSEFIEDAILSDMYIYHLSPTKDIYPYIGKKFKTTSSRVERVIRYSCMEAWKNMDEYLKESIFPNGSEKIPTNSEAMYAIYEYIKGHYLFNDNIIKKTVFYKDDEVREETENYINYKIRFETQRLLYQRFGLSTGITRNLPMLVDMIILSIKHNKTLTDADIQQILNQLGKIYNLYEGSYDSYLDGFVSCNEAEKTVLRLCNRIYEKSNESFALQKPKNKTYIKKYINTLSLMVKDNLPFYI